MLRACLARLLAEEKGAVTVDWITLTGALVGLAVLVVLKVAEGATDVSTAVGTALSEAEVPNIIFIERSPGPGSAAAGSGSTATSAPEGSLAP